jgi:hypothetical protein
MREESQISEKEMKSRKWHNPVTRKNVGRSMHSMLDGSFLTRKKFIRAIPFILFLMFLGILYITNIFRVESTKRQLDNLEEDLRELRYEYISSRSKLMFESKPSAVSYKLTETGIKESLVPPKKIKINEEVKAPEHAGY